MQFEFEINANVFIWHAIGANAWMISKAVPKSSTKAIIGALRHAEQNFHQWKSTKHDVLFSLIGWRPDQYLVELTEDYYSNEWYFF